MSVFSTVTILSARSEECQVIYSHHRLPSGLMVNIAHQIRISFAPSQVCMCHWVCVNICPLCKLTPLSAERARALVSGTRSLCGVCHLNHLHARVFAASCVAFASEHKHTRADSLHSSGCLCDCARAPLSAKFDVKKPAASISDFSLAPHHFHPTHRNVRSA
jgi:hypothetical protein